MDFARYVVVKHNIKATLNGICNSTGNVGKSVLSVKIASERFVVFIHAWNALSRSKSAYILFRKFVLEIILRLPSSTLHQIRFDHLFLFNVIPFV